MPLVVAGSVVGEFEGFSGEIFKDGGDIQRRRRHI